MANKQLRHTAKEIDDGLDKLTQIGQEVGDLNNLVTSSKENLVDAVNEAYNHGGGGGYQPPVGGIPKSDLDSNVQQSLNKADSALQSHQNLKTINGQSITGTGDLIIHDGEKGKSAYELAVENGYGGTLSMWLNSLKGNDGAKGTDGTSFAGATALYGAYGTKTDGTLTQKFSTEELTDLYRKCGFTDRMLLSGFGTDYLNGRATAVGRTFYRTSDKKLLTCVVYPSQFDEIPLSYKTIYRNANDGKDYVWDGTGMVRFSEESLKQYLEAELNDRKNYRLYNLTRNNGLDDILQLPANSSESWCYTKEWIPIGFNEEIIIVGGNLANVWFNSEMKSTFNTGLQGNWQTETREDGVTIYHIVNTSPTNKYFTLWWNVYQDSSLERDKYPKSISVKKNADTYLGITTIESINELFISFTQPSYTFRATPLIEVGEGDLVKYLVEDNYHQYLYKGTGLAYYDENKQLIKLLGLKVSKMGTYASVVIPKGVKYIQYTSQKSAGLSIIRGYRGEIREACARGGVYTTLLHKEGTPENIVSINGENYVLGYTSNVAQCVVNEKTMLVAGGWAIIYTGSRPSDRKAKGAALWMKKTEDGGITWSNMKVLFDTMKWTAQKGSTVYMHAPAMTIDKNGRIWLMFQLDGYSGVADDYGVVDYNSGSRIYVMYSDNEGESWSEITEVSKAISDSIGKVLTGAGCRYGATTTSNGKMAFAVFGTYQGGTCNGILVTSDNGVSWTFVRNDSLNNETALSEYGDNNILILVRATEGAKNQKRVYRLNVANDDYNIISEDNLTNSRIFGEAVGIGQEGEFGEIARIRLGDHYALLYAMQEDDTREVTLFVSHDLKKMIPVCRLLAPDGMMRIYTRISVKGSTILCVNRTAEENSKEVFAHVCSGVYDRLESIGIVDDVRKAIDSIEFSSSDTSTSLATKLNSLVSSLKSNGFMKDWRDYTNKMGFASEVLQAPQYEGFVKSGGTNQGLAFCRHICENKVGVRITIPSVNYPADATTIRFAICWTNNGWFKTIDAPIISRTDTTITAVYNGGITGPSYAELLYVYWYRGVTKSVAKTEGVKIEVYE